MKHILDNYLISDVRLTTGSNWSRNRDGQYDGTDITPGRCSPNRAFMRVQTVELVFLIERERKSCARAAWVLCVLSAALLARAFLYLSPDWLALERGNRGERRAAQGRQRASKLTTAAAERARA